MFQLHGMDKFSIIWNRFEKVLCHLNIAFLFFKSVYDIALKSIRKEDMTIQLVSFFNGSQWPVIWHEHQVIGNAKDVVPALNFFFKVLTKKITSKTYL